MKHMNPDILTTTDDNVNSSTLFIENCYGIPYASLGICKGKVIPVLNQAPCHEGVLGSGGMAPRILDLGTRWR
jgi:hypothetical protein